MRTPCIQCGEPAEGGRCDDHPRGRPGLAPTTERGYDSNWRRLSERARRMSPVCEDCLSTTDLTVDHSPEAWARKAAGKSIRLRDVAVVCRSCNARRGRARPQGGRGDREPKRLAGEARSQSQTALRAL